MVTMFLATKLHTPSPRHSLVPRQRLLERLDHSLHCALTVVSAPAGFGKTTLLAAWARGLESSEPEPVHVAWLSLDDGDNDPARFAAYLTAALTRAGIDSDRVGGQASELTRHTSNLTRPYLRETHLVSLINTISASPHGYVLVLDDYHLITSQAVNDVVSFLVDHTPENLHLVVATRADPPLPLPRLRARGSLVELRQRDLRFTAGEAANFLNNVMGLDLTPEDVAALEARTEGWIAGLQMAALSLQGHSSRPVTRSAHVQAFTGSHRFVLDYLVEEVLDQQPPGVQDFLLKTSVLDRMTGALCDWILGTGKTGEWESRELGNWDSGQVEHDLSTSVRINQPCDVQVRNATGSQALLEHLDAANLFIIPLDDDRQWFRYHRLFSDLLRRRLAQTAPELVPVLYRKASMWYEEQGLMAAAIDHALAAGDVDRAADLVGDTAEATLMRSEVTTFLNWVDRLPEESVRVRPNLCFYHAWAWAMTGKSVQIIERRLHDIECAESNVASSGVGLAPLFPGRKTALRAYMGLFQGDLLRAAELSRAALERLPESDRFLRGIMAWILSLAQLADVDLATGTQTLEELAELGQAIDNPMIQVTALCQQAKLLTRQGKLHRAGEVLDWALELATDSQGQHLPIASEALIGLGSLWFEWNDLEAAENYLSEGIALASEWSALAAFDAYLPLAQIKQAQGDEAAARAALRTARQLALRSEATEIDDLVADLAVAHISVLQGDLPSAQRWAEARGLLPEPPAGSLPGLDEGEDYVTSRLRKYERLVVARYLAILGCTEKALDLLGGLLAEARQLGRIDLIIEVQILSALAWQSAGSETHALDALSEALTLAEPGGFARAFLDEGEAMARLLREVASRRTTPAYVARLLAAFHKAEATKAGSESAVLAAQSLVEPLSERELQVLRLLATGMSNPEIAEELVIAVSTVRSHCKSIYGKLDVHRRWDAVQRGRELGLIR